MASSGSFETTKEVTKFPVPNKSAIEYLFKRACHTINSHSPLEMSDPVNVSRVLGELFAQMQHDEARWTNDLRTAKGWVCDLPKEVGGGAVSLTTINPSSSRLQVQGNAKWSTAKPLELNAEQRKELEDTILIKFAQQGFLLEVSSDSQLVSSSSSEKAGASTRITLVGNSKEEMRVFHIKEHSATRKIMTKILTFAQQLNLSQNGQAIAAMMLQ